MEKTHAYVLALGRVLLSSLFIWAGYGKLKDPGAVMQYFAKVGVPQPSLVVWVAILIEFVGGIALLVGFRKSVGMPFNFGLGRRGQSSLRLVFLRLLVERDQVRKLGLVLRGRLVIRILLRLGGKTEGQRRRHYDSCQYSHFEPHIGCTPILGNEIGGSLPGL